MVLEQEIWVGASTFVVAELESLQPGGVTVCKGEGGSGGVKVGSVAVAEKESG